MTVAGDVGDARGDRPARVELADRHAVDLELLDRPDPGAEERRRHLLAPGPEHAGDAEDLPLM